MNVNNSEWIDYESFRKNSFDEVLGDYKNFKTIRGRKQGSPEVKESQQVFQSFHEKTFEDKEEELKNNIKIKASKERFLEQFVGPTFRAFQAK